jgi:uncharacterized repeat protein (TIGR01451 family)
MIPSTPVQLCKRILVILTACVLQLSCALVFAADNGVSAELRAFKVVATANGPALVATTEALPGDTIEYQVTYRNSAASPARDVLATLPVPSGGMAYVAGSAAPAKVMASLDGKQYAPVPLTRTVVRDGKQVTETVPAAEYRFLRWQLGELAPGRSATVSSRMRLEGASKQ